MTVQEYEELERGDIVYYARIMPQLGYYEVHTLVIITHLEEYCTGTESESKQTFIFNPKNACMYLFKERDDAVNALKEFKIKYKDVRIICDRKDDN